MTVNVYFFGIICHVQTNAPANHKDFAAVVKADDHTPMIWGYSGGKLKPQLLSADVTFRANGIRVGPARMDGLFDNLVPNLLTDHLTGGSLKFDVKNHGHDAVHSYVHYVRDSVLFSSLRYPFEVKYEGIEGTRCIAKLNRLQIPGDAVDIPGYNIRLTPETPALIMNGSRDAGSSEPHNKQYKKILDNGDVAGAHETASTCDEIIESVPDWVVAVITAWSATTVPDEKGDPKRNGTVVITTLRVECANTQWP